MPDHPALCVLITLPMARKLFPGVPSSVFHEVGQPGHGRGLRLTFGAAYAAAAAHWAPRAKEARAARFSITHQQTWKARRAAAAEAGLAHLQAVITAELAALAGQGD